MRGTYRVYSEGRLVAEQPNLITTAGAKTILRYLAGDIRSIGGAVAVGTGHTMPALTDTKLAFEFSRAAVDFTTVNYFLNQVIFKAPMDPNAAGLIYELGLYPFLLASPNEFSSLIISGFESELESLTGGTVDFTQSRNGDSSYRLDALASATAVATVSNLSADYSGYDPTDSFSLAYFTNDANTATITVRLLNDTTNYYSYSFTPNAVQNYYVQDIPKADFVATGSPKWDGITSAEFRVTAGAGGATAVHLDGFRVNDTDSYADFVLVSRSALAAPIIKRPGQSMDIEYVLEFNA